MNTRDRTTDVRKRLEEIRAQMVTLPDLGQASQADARAGLIAELGEVIQALRPKDDDGFLRYDRLQEGGAIDERVTYNGDVVRGVVAVTWEARVGERPVLVVGAQGIVQIEQRLPFLPSSP